MKIEELIEVYKDSRIKKVGGNYFISHLWKSYSFPLSNIILINDQVVKYLKWRYLISVIYTESAKKNTYEFIVDTNDYSLDRFSSKTRNQIKKSLSTFSFEKPSLEEMITDGFRINQKTLKEQKREDRILSTQTPG